jgi:DEAD/DEAH box helicase domain-containing protein
MNSRSKVDEYIQSLNASQRLGPQIAFQKLMPANEPVWSVPKKPWTETMQRLLYGIGISKLYQHQIQALDYIRSGRHVIVATPTASGKTLIYNLPVLEKIMANVHSNALYIFPLKALAQDQLKTFQKMAEHCDDPKPTAGIYDGDTSAWHRKRIREAPPNVVLTNPEMLHLSILAHNPKWAAFLSNLDIVVVDEVHTYRGVMGSHVAQIFRRFRRICEHYGATPTYIFSSATLANPGQLAEQLSGLSIATVDQSGAPQGQRRLIFIDPAASPAQAAILLLKAALTHELRTIVYTQSRKLAELIAVWASSKSGTYAPRISAYRAGLLPQERRDIESRLASGDLLAVISTSALELGIDIGDLDLCVLVGYPGSVVSTWQRGGRVGRSGQDSAIILIAGEDALDQYFIRNPQDFIQRKPEAAVVNPYNAEIFRRHLVCAATELPLNVDELFLKEAIVQKRIAELEEEGKLLRSADGKRIFSSRKAPHRYIDIRGAGKRMAILSTRTGEPRGEIDAFRACRETHPGAVYLHRGATYIVDRLDLAATTVHVSRAQLNYYTRVRADKSTEILDVHDERFINETRAYLGQIRVSDHVTAYETWDIQTRTLRNRYPLDLPPQIFETQSLWFQLPASIQSEIESRHLDYMGGLHALEHAAIGIFPLLVMADRNDIGGLSTLYHPQVGAAAIFIYDGIPGGAGMAQQAFAQAEQLFEYTLKSIRHCTCDSGCPSCVHSPKCGSGNRPMDKAAALRILAHLQKQAKPMKPKILSADQPKKRWPGQKENQPGAPKTVVKKIIKTPAAEELYYGVFDLETQRSAADVGGWHRADQMGISCAVLYDNRKKAYLRFVEDQVDEFIARLDQFDLVIGFNVKRFDYRVLSGYTRFNFNCLNTLDILEDIYNHLGFRVSLAHLAEITLNARKSADGLQALRWWKEGRIDEILEYCKQDVRITRNLYLFGQKNGHVLFANKAGERVRIPVNW